MAWAESGKNKSSDISTIGVTHLRSPAGVKIIYDRISKAMTEYIAVRKKAIKSKGYFRTIQTFDDRGKTRQARVWTKTRRSDFMLVRFVLTIQKIAHGIKKELFTNL
ncbi:MAG: hypothetical protein KKH08_03310 [Candidatus Omnitrophica bacterium]|nr:hypothetical protein [Candidatus Omnitrophota bacterium]